MSAAMGKVFFLWVCFVAGVFFVVSAARAPLITTRDYVGVALDVFIAAAVFLMASAFVADEFG